MKRRSATIAVSGLRWTLGTVLLLESVHFAISPASTRHLAQFGAPPWVHPALGWTEAAAALAFLIPASTVAGGCALLATLTGAMAIHIRGGEFGVGSLVVYAVAVVVCMTHRERSAAGDPA